MLYVEVRLIVNNQCISWSFLSLLIVPFPCFVFGICTPNCNPYSSACLTRFSLDVTSTATSTWTLTNACCSQSMNLTVIGQWVPNPACHCIIWLHRLHVVLIKRITDWCRHIGSNVLSCRVLNLWLHALRGFLVLVIPTTKRLHQFLIFLIVVWWLEIAAPALESERTLETHAFIVFYRLIYATQVICLLLW